MKLTNLIAAAALAALSLDTQAATIVVPVAGTGPGSNDSHWQSELTLHNAAPRGITFSIAMHSGTDVLGPVAVVLQARETLSIEDIARTKFGMASGNGALVLDLTDRDARGLAVTSRTFNTSPNGEFGQNIPAVDGSAALRTGDIAALPGPASVATNRFNFGIFATETAQVEWSVVRKDGTVAATKTATYPAGLHRQFNSGVESLIGATPQDGDTVHARILGGRAIFYGSIVNGTGDPTFVPGIRTREDILIQFLGVDLDENGTVDVPDANLDGVLDAPVQLIRSFFSNYFRVVASGEFGEDVTFEIVSSPGTAKLLDADGTLIVSVGANDTGSSGEIVLRATSEGSEQLITIPVTLK